MSLPASINRVAPLPGLHPHEVNESSSARDQAVPKPGATRLDRARSESARSTGGVPCGSIFRGFSRAPKPPAPSAGASMPPRAPPRAVCLNVVARQTLAGGGMLVSGSTTSTIRPRATLVSMYAHAPSSAIAAIRFQIERRRAADLDKGHFCTDGSLGVCLVGPRLRGARCGPQPPCTRRRPGRRPSGGRRRAG
jgi:hypothetical protein